MIFLTAASIQPDDVPAERKRNALDNLLIEDETPWIDTKGQALIVLHTESSQRRKNMPISFIQQLLHFVLENTQMHIATTSHIDQIGPRIHDMTEASFPLRRLIALLREADLVLSVDTSVYHFADALGIPSIVFFTAFTPIRYSKYYPTVNAITVPCIDHTPGLEIYDWSAVDFGEIGNFIYMISESIKSASTGGAACCNM